VNFFPRLLTDYTLDRAELIWPSVQFGRGVFNRNLCPGVEHLYAKMSEGEVQRRIGR